MAAKLQHPFYQTVSVLAHNLPEQQDYTCDLALLIAAELAGDNYPQRQSIIRKDIGVSTDTVMHAINKHVPDDNSLEAALLRSGLEMLLFKALYDLRHQPLSQAEYDDTFNTLANKNYPNAEEFLH